MKHLHISTSRFGEGFQAGTDDTGGFVIHDVAREPEPYISRPNSAPAYYQSRPASRWIAIMKPRSGRPAAGQILRGKLRAGGRRPWVALRFSALLTRP